MKFIFTIVSIILFFQINISYADDISNFEIEGISVKSSLLDYFSIKEIEKSITKNILDDDKYIGALFENKNFKVFNFVEVFFLKNDPNYIVHSVRGSNFINNLEDCYLQQNIISADVEKLFDSYEKEIVGPEKHWFDKSNKSIVKNIVFWMEDDSLINTECVSWSSEIKKNYNFGDTISLDIRTSQYNSWYNNL